jgi:hypothetical protein
MPGDPCADITSLSPYYLTDEIDVTLGTNDHWRGIWRGAGGTATLKPFWPQSIAPWASESLDNNVFLFLMAGFHNNILTLATYKNTKIK